MTQEKPSWCPGCGNYSILSSIQEILEKLNMPQEDVVFISGIGCSSRLPYYIKTFGFHTLHGRAPTIATGLKLINPKLSVWVITGDADGLGIGANHLLHLFRRNHDIKVLFFNNHVMALTKGQMSPTSELNQTTTSSPLGCEQSPVHPVTFALAAGASFVGKVDDSNKSKLQEILKMAAKHTGSVFIEINQHCRVFDKRKKSKNTNSVMLTDKKPILFTNDDRFGLALGHDFQIKKIKTSHEKPLIYNQKNKNLALLLAQYDLKHHGQIKGIFYKKPSDSN